MGRVVLLFTDSLLSPYVYVFHLIDFAVTSNDVQSEQSSSRTRSYAVTIREEKGREGSMTQNHKCLT